MNWLAKAGSATCARTLFWKAFNWLAAATELPRSIDASAAHNVAINGFGLRTG